MAKELISLFQGYRIALDVQRPGEEKKRTLGMLLLSSGNYICQQNQTCPQEKKVNEATADLLDHSEEPSHYKHSDDQARQDSDGTSHSIPLCLFVAILGGEGPDVKAATAT